jgi:ABC-type nitrate/sulfonate/bicarbonate transport system substrate-binding protein
MLRTARLVASFLALIAVAGCALVAPAAVPRPTAGPPRTALSVALDWVPNTNHTGIFVAMQQGWYDAEGLDVTILPYAQGNAPDVLVAAGKADFGIATEQAVTLARAGGRPVVSVAAIIQKNTSAFVALRESGLDRPVKLQGKRYAGFGSPFEEPVIETVLKCDGASEGKVQVITANVFGFDALVAKQADFVWIFQGWEGVQAKRQNVELNTMSPLDYCVPNYYSPVLVTSDQVLKDKADAVRGFMRATSRGFELATSDPDQAADLLIKAAPSGSFPDVALVKESARWLAPKYAEGKTHWGEQDLQVWTDYPKFMLKSGRVKDASGALLTSELDYPSFFTNEYLPH